MAFYWGKSDEESDRDEARFKAEVQRDILRIYGLKPWHVGLKPVPARVRLWHWLRRILKAVVTR